MSAWKQGRILSSKCWSVLKEHPSLLRWPAFGVIAGIPGVAVLVGGAVVAGGENGSAAGLVLVALGAYLSVLGAMLCSAALVAGADQALRGQEPEGELGIALGRLGAIAGWALIQTVVGWLLQSLSRPGGGDGPPVLAIIRVVLGALLSTAWALLTFFVLPLVVLEGFGPVAAIKRSSQLFRERWGTQLMGSFRIGMMVVLFGMLPSIALIAGGAVLLGSGAPVGGAVVLIALGALGLLAASLVANAMKLVFGVALLRYAESGEALGPFEADELAEAVRVGRRGTPAVA